MKFVNLETFLVNSRGNVTFGSRGWGLGPGEELRGIGR